mgnify:FL=1
MPEEVIENLLHDNDGDYLDCTFGMGGHSKAILKKLSKRGSLKAIDKDPKVFQFSKKINDTRFEFINSSFSDLQDYFINDSFDGILLDLGISSIQLDDMERGFSFKNDANLDMRMDQSTGMTASDWLNKSSEKEIADVLFLFGEERKSRNLARQIIEKRRRKEISSTSDLTSLKFSSIRSKKHPATNIFRAIRMFINNEVEELISVLQSSIKLLKEGGRLVVISFHSIEDRIVKNFLKGNLGDISFENLVKQKGKIIKPSCDEIKNNPRARSAILRVGEKL